MACKNITLVDKNNKVLNENLLNVGEEFYIILKLDEDQEFVGWKDLNNEYIDMELVETFDCDCEGGETCKCMKFKASPVCGGGFIAVIKTKDDMISMIAVYSNDINMGTADCVLGCVDEEGIPITNLDGHTVTIRATDKCCYKFSHWESDNDSGSTDNPKQITVAGVGIHNYTAIFVKDVFHINVSFDGNMGMYQLKVNGVETNDASCGDSISLVAHPNKDYVFDKWILPDGSENTSPSIESYVIKCEDINKSIRLVFRERDVANIFYNSNDERAEENFDCTKNVGETFETKSSTYFVRTNKTIAGWSTHPELGTIDYQTSTSYTVTDDGNLVLYAIWEDIPTHSVTLYPRHATVKTPIVHSGYVGETITLDDLSSDETYEWIGMEFVGWSLSTSGDNPINGSYVIPGADVVMYGVWNVVGGNKATAKYIFDNGTATPLNTTENVTFNESYTVKDVADFRWVYPHHTFDGWHYYTNNYDNGTVQPGDSVFVSEREIFFEARWVEDVKHTITYHYDDYDESDDGYAGDNITLRDGSDLEREGYVCVKWMDADDNQYPFNQTIVLNNDLELWPVWNQKCYVYLSKNNKGGNIMCNGSRVDNDNDPVGTEYSVDITNDVDIDGVCVNGDYNFIGIFDVSNNDYVIPTIVGTDEIYSFDCGGHYRLIFESVETFYATNVGSTPGTIRVFCRDFYDNSWLSDGDNFGVETVYYTKDLQDDWIGNQQGEQVGYVQLQPNETVYFKSNLINDVDGTIRGRSVRIETKNSKFKLGGNIMSLLYKNDFSNKTTLTKDYTFNHMLCGYNIGDNGVTDIEDVVLPATTITKSCYNGMFRGGKYTKAPSLPATNLKEGCYSRMFSRSELATRPNLPATNLADNCYLDMFSYSKITDAGILPATTLAPGCYANMFKDCTSLTIGATMNATTIPTSACASMYEGCTSLTVAPNLPAETIGKYGYSRMFCGCTSLTTIPSLNFTSLTEMSCDSMFYGCTSLVNNIPELKPVELAKLCYVSMFEGCTSLTTAPLLPARNVPNYGAGLGPYNKMFYDCSNLNYIKAMFKERDLGFSNGNSAWLGSYPNGPGMPSSTGTFVGNVHHNTPQGPDERQILRLPNGWTITNVEP